MNFPLILNLHETHRGPTSYSYSPTYYFRLFTTEVVSFLKGYQSWLVSTLPFEPPSNLYLVSPHTGPKLLEKCPDDTIPKLQTYFLTLSTED